MHRPMATLQALAAIVVLSVALVGCGGSSPTTTAPAVSVTTAAPSDTSTSGSGGATIDVKALFAANCASCHGTDGTGGAGPNLVERGPTLTLDRITTQITDGGTQMPAFGAQLSADEIGALATYVNGGLK